MGRLGSEMWVSASFQIIPHPVDRLGLGLGLGLHVVDRLRSGMLVSTSFQLRWIALNSSLFSIYRLAHGDDCRGMSYTI